MPTFFIFLTSFCSLMAKNMPKIIKHCSCSTELCLKFQLLIKFKMLKFIFLAFKLPDAVLILLIKIKMPTIMSGINIMLISVKLERVLLSYLLV